MANLPTGTVTFLYTDLEGSTRLWERHPDAMRRAVDGHLALLRDAVVARGGVVFRTVGDGLCAAFAVAPQAVAAALAAQQALLAEPWEETGLLRVRMALHTGAAAVQGGDYVGACLNRLGRLLAAGHGGQALLSQATAELVREALPEGAGLRDLGEQRLRDLERAEHVYQLVHPSLPADFSPLQSLDAARHNLPLQLTSFVGREQELGQIKQELERARLLTLTGVGGCGKTRLALQVAAELLERYPDGVWLVELAPLADPALLPGAIAAALGVREAPGQTILETLLGVLRDKRLLLVLDNCEHLLDACAHVADALLRRCPGVQLLATSREALGIAGEVSWRVPSLAIPTADAAVSLDALLRCDAVRLFIDRALAVQPAFQLTNQNAPAVAQICARLDGIPLAVELAAARVKALTVEQIAARLNDRFRLLTGGSRTALPRQQTLRALIDWSYDLLTAQEQLLFERLSVFAGGWTLEAAEAVVADGSGEIGNGNGDAETPAKSLTPVSQPATPIAREDVLDLLARLVDRSLVVAEEGEGGEERYRLLETLRQYGRERLAAGGEAEATRGRHAAYYLELAERAAPEMMGPRIAHWLRRLNEEIGNLRAALRWSVEEGDVERALRVSGGLAGFWYLHGFPGEGRAWLEELLALPKARQRTLGRGAALSSAGLLAWDQGDFAAARTFLDEALTIQRDGGDRLGVSWTLWHMGMLAMTEGALDEGHAKLEAVLALARELGHQDMISRALHFLGQVAFTRGDYAPARSLQEQSLVVRRRIGDLQGIASSLNWLGHVATAQGDYAAARAHYDESLAVRQQVDYRGGVAYTLSGHANLAAAQGQHARAARLSGAAAALCENAGMASDRTQQGGLRERLPACRDALGAAAYDAAWAEGHALSQQQAIAYALAVDDDA